MAVFRIEKFAGVAPAKSPKLLNNGIGQESRNISFKSGRFEPLKDDSSVASTSSGLINSIHYYERVGVSGGSLFQFTESGVKVVESPVADDTYERAYWTGQSYPRYGSYASMISGSSTYPATSYRLGVPAPSGAPGITVTAGTAEGEDPVDRAYVYTLVTAFGEEGPPSAVSTVVEITSTDTVEITLPSTQLPSGNYNFDTSAANTVKRIYRANSGSTGAYFQFVAQVAYTTASFTDTVDDSALGEVLPSTGWVGPPDDNTSLYPDGPLQGLIPVGNGVFAGFAGKRLCLSEPYLPHAWPVQYRITIEEEIVGISATNNGIIVMTKGFPYFVTGTEPSAMTAVQVDLAQSCLNKESIVDMGEYVLYAGPDGLVQISNTTGSVVSAEYITPAQWNDDFSWGAGSYQASLYEGSYVAFWADSQGNMRGWKFDPRRPEDAFSELDWPIASAVGSQDIRGSFYRKSTGKFYYLRGSSVYEFGGSSDNRVGYYRSKVFLSQPTSMSVMKVVGDLTNNNQNPAEFYVSADGSMVYSFSLEKNPDTHATNPNGYTLTSSHSGTQTTYQTNTNVVRLPSNHGTEWEIVIECETALDEVILASTMAELNQ